VCLWGGQVFERKDLLRPEHDDILNRLREFVRSFTTSTGPGAGGVVRPVGVDDTKLVRGGRSAGLRVKSHTSKSILVVLRISADALAPHQAVYVRS
jgi:hypothetical protein